MGALANGWAFLTQLAAAFVLAPLLLNHLGHARYGAWSLIESLLAYFTLLDFGISATIVRYVARSQATGDHNGLKRLVSACLLVFWGAGLLVATVGVGLLLFVLRLSNKVPPSIHAEVSGMAIVLVITLAFQCPLSVFPACLDGLSRFTDKAIIRTLFLLLRVCGVLALVRFNGSLKALALLFAATTLGESITCGIWVRRWLPGISLAPWQADRESIRQIRGYSMDAFLAMIAGRISFKTDAIVIGLCGQLDLIPFFDMPARLTEYAKNLIRSATTTLTPAFSALEATGRQRSMKDLFLVGSRFAAYLSLPLKLGLFAFGGAFLERWLGQGEYRFRGEPVLWILAGTISVGMLQSVAARVLYGIGQIRRFARLMLVEAAINLLLSLVLFPVCGITGVALGTLLPNVAFSTIVVITVCIRLGIGRGEYVKQALLRPVIASALLAAIWWRSGHQPSASSWLEMVQEGGLGLAAYSGFALIVEWATARRRTKWSPLRPGSPIPG
jgi:O-antigen/teichoic acid export membrane protein